MSESNIFETIQSDISSNDIVLYMKGNKTFPMCGFSSAVVAVMNNLGVDFADRNVLEDPELREGIKQFSNWPTIPQLYVKGEFIGGCDIVREMFETGELQQLLAEKQIIKAA